MNKPTINIYQQERQLLEDFLCSPEDHLCLILGTRGQGKSTLFSRTIDNLHRFLVVNSSLDEENSTLINTLVCNLTNHILSSQEITGYRWNHLLSTSTIPIEPLIQLDDRLGNLIEPRQRPLDESSNLKTVFKRATKELFLLSSQNLPFPIIWKVDSTECASPSDLAIIKEIIEDPRNSGIKTIISINTDDVEANRIIQEFVSIQHKAIHLNPLTTKQCRSFLSELYPNCNDVILEKMAVESNGNIFDLITYAMESNLGPKLWYSSNSFIEDIVTSIPNGRSIATIASLIGKRFDASDLIAVHQSSRTEIDEGLAELERYNILAKDRQVYSWVSSSRLLK